MWKAVLVDELREILERDDALARMRGFSTERWLGKTVRDRGTADQIAAFDALLRSLELLDGVEVAEDEDAVRYGLPSDIARPPRPDEPPSRRRFSNEPPFLAGPHRSAAAYGG